MIEPQLVVPTITLNSVAPDGGLIVGLTVSVLSSPNSDKADTCLGPVTVASPEITRPALTRPFFADRARAVSGHAVVPSVEMAPGGVNS